MRINRSSWIHISGARFSWTGTTRQSAQNTFIDGKFVWRRPCEKCLLSPGIEPSTPLSVFIQSEFTTRLCAIDVFAATFGQKPAQTCANATSWNLARSGDNFPPILQFRGKSHSKMPIKQWHRRETLGAGQFWRQMGRRGLSASSHHRLPLLVAVWVQRILEEKQDIVFIGFFPRFQENSGLHLTQIFWLLFCFKPVLYAFYGY